MPLRQLVRAHRAQQHKFLQEQKILAEDAAGFRTNPRWDLRVAIDRNIIAERILGKISDGGYESTEATLLPLLVQPEDSVLELGAGLGFIAAMLMTHCRPRAYCAIEADARLIPLIQRTLDLNNVKGEVEVRNAILTEDAKKLREGSVPFLVEEEFWESRESETENGISVETLSLNELLREHSISVLIVDIEGGEATLLDGADLSAVRAVSLELHPSIIGAAGVQKIFRCLHEGGFVYDIAFSSFGIVTFTRPSRPRSTVTG